MVIHEKTIIELNKYAPSTQATILNIAIASLMDEQKNRIERLINETIEFLRVDIK